MKLDLTEMSFELYYKLYQNHFHYTQDLPRAFRGATLTIPRDTQYERFYTVKDSHHIFPLRYGRRTSRTVWPGRTCYIHEHRNKDGHVTSILGVQSKDTDPYKVLKVGPEVKIKVPFEEIRSGLQTTNSDHRRRFFDIWWNLSQSTLIEPHVKEYIRSHIKTWPTEDKCVQYHTNPERDLKHAGVLTIQVAKTSPVENLTKLDLTKGTKIVFRSVTFFKFYSQSMRSRDPYHIMRQVDQQAARRQWESVLTEAFRLWGPPVESHDFENDCSVRIYQV